MATGEYLNCYACACARPRRRLQGPVVSAQQASTAPTRSQQEAVATTCAACLWSPPQQHAVLHGLDRRTLAASLAPLASPFPCYAARLMSLLRLLRLTSF